MMEEQKAKKAKKGNGFFVLLALIYLISGGAFLYFLFTLNVLPAKYLYPGVAVLLVITLFTLPCMFSKRGKQGRKIFSAIISLILIGVFGAGTYYLASTGNFFSNITAKTVATEDYHVIVRTADMPGEEEWEEMSKDDKAELIAGKLNGTKVGTYNSNDQMYSKAKAMLQSEYTVDFEYDDSAKKCIKALLKEKHNAILLPVASYEALKSDENMTVEDDTEILYTVKVPKETVDRTKAVDVTKESFNILISGTDKEGYRSDVNMVATVNPVKHEVLLTSIPRDLYVTLPSKDAKDKLTHSRIYGLEETQAAVETELGIDINYYVSVNYSALKRVVDAIGGIDVESQYDFYTSGMGSLNGHHFTVGMNHMDGRAALAFCRERHSFQSGDMTRNENQQAVLEAIIKKATSSSTILSSYTDILEAVSGKLITTMGQEEISSLVKMQLDGMPDWTIRKNAIKGETGSDMCYALGQYASVVYPQAGEITRAVDEIVKTAMNE